VKGSKSRLVGSDESHYFLEEAIEVTHVPEATDNSTLTTTLSTTLSTTANDKDKEVVVREEVGRQEEVQDLDEEDLLWQLSRPNDNDDDNNAYNDDNSSDNEQEPPPSLDTLLQEQETTTPMRSETNVRENSTISGISGNPITFMTVVTSVNYPGIPTAIDGRKLSVPQPLKPVMKEEQKDCKSFVIMQVSEGRGFIPGAKIAVEIFRRKLTDKSGKRQKICSTSVKQSDKPVWDERFQICVYNAEIEALTLSLKSVGVIKQKLPGEIVIPLSSKSRDFDSPQFAFKWFPLLSRDQSDRCGELKLYIEYFE